MLPTLVIITVYVELWKSCSYAHSRFGACPEEYDAYIEELKEMKEKGVTGLTTLEKEYYESMDAPEIEMKTIEQAVAEPRGGEEVWAQCSACHNAYPSAPKTLDDWQI